MMEVFLSPNREMINCLYETQQIAILNTSETFSGPFIVGLIHLTGQHLPASLKATFLYENGGIFIIPNETIPCVKVLGNGQKFGNHIPRGREKRKSSKIPPIP